MTEIWPLRFREVAPASFLFTDDAGGYFKANSDFLDRYISDELTDADRSFLSANGQAFEHDDDLSFTGFCARWAQRINKASKLDFVILVPTLRCNLSCDYCQVSRVSEHARGFDWSEEQLQAVLAWLDRSAGPSLKVEFQGGECLLRLDLLERVRTYCRKRFDRCEFVVCTNLQNVSDEAWRFLAEPDTSISTSLDGTIARHEQQRTRSQETTCEFISNLDRAARSFVAGKVSALPTLNPDEPPPPQEIIKTFTSYGLNSVFLRRINHQGFARKRYAGSHSADQWIVYYRRFVEAVIEHNLSAENPFEEFYLAHLVRRILQGRHNGHVNLRNPNWVAHDYLVIDYDGRFYPSDEARMMTRVGQIDLSLGDVMNGLDDGKRASFQEHVSNFDDPDCQHCAFQPYCGLDIIDDISRYGRIDLPRPLTEHCQLHQGLFDLAFELIYSTDPATQLTVQRWLGLGSRPEDIAPRLP